MDVQEIGITTICEGSVNEVFQREFSEVLKNVADPNTDPEGVRRLTLTFTIKPHEDRHGAQVFFTCKASLQPVVVAKAPVFLSRHTGTLKAYTVDQRQGALFGDAADAKTMAVVK